jgi:hypothetical protein
MTDTTTIRAEIGTSGDFGEVTLTSDPHEAIGDAVELEHSCEDAACDISRALDDGFPLWSAYLLQGATECPLLDAVIGHYAGTEALPDWQEAAEAERVAWLASDTWTKHAHECESCGAYTFGDDYWTPERCENCLAVFPRLSDDELDEFVTGYIESALWSSSIEEDFARAHNAETGDDIAPDTSMQSFGLTDDDISDDARSAIEDECRDFCKATYADLCAYVERMGEWHGQDSVRGADARYSGWEQAGGDFWLTRNGHGVGFWDRGLGELGDRLTAASKPHGSSDLYIGDDGKVSVS